LTLAYLESLKARATFEELRVRVGEFALEQTEKSTLTAADGAALIESLRPGSNPRRADAGYMTEDRETIAASHATGGSVRAALARLRFRSTKPA
jgi:hypothetical protein